MIIVNKLSKSQLRELESSNSQWVAFIVLYKLQKDGKPKITQITS